MRTPRNPLRARRASNDPIIEALDEMDERNAERHAQTHALLRFTVGGTIIVALVAMLIVGASRGVAPSEVAGGITPIIRSISPAFGAEGEPDAVGP